MYKVFLSCRCFVCQLLLAYGAGVVSVRTVTFVSRSARQISQAVLHRMSLFPSLAAIQMTLHCIARLMDSLSDGCTLHAPRQEEASASTQYATCKCLPEIYTRAVVGVTSVTASQESPPALHLLYQYLQAPLLQKLLVSVVEGWGGVIVC